MVLMEILKETFIFSWKHTMFRRSEVILTLNISISYMLKPILTMLHNLITNTLQHGLNTEIEL